MNKARGREDGGLRAGQWPGAHSTSISPAGLWCEGGERRAPASRRALVGRMPSSWWTTVKTLCLVQQMCCCEVHTDHEF